MSVSKDQCQLCKMEAGASKIVEASKGDIGKAIVASCITGIIGYVANPDIHKNFCNAHHAQLMAGTIQAIGIMAERAMAEGEVLPAELPKPRPRGKDFN